MAEEVGVEPTRRILCTSLVLKTRRPTGDIALPSFSGIEKPGRHRSLQYYTSFSHTAGKSNAVKIFENIDSDIAAAAEVIAIFSNG